MVYKVFDKKTCGWNTSGGSIENKNMLNQELGEELHNTIIRIFERQKVHSSFMDNNWGADHVDMQLMSKLNKGFGFLLCVIDIYSEYAEVVSLKDKKCSKIINAFQNNFD